ncbi:MAG: type I-E CRISPR-associated protein Cas6/Cse3/CasE [Tepidisphaeraceae bacterium]|jgi:CRISPR system Cascade subunit CasE
MYLSTLLIDVGQNPDRPRPGRLWLRNLYRVHQRLCMAFPSNKRKDEDAQMLQPFKPEDFGAGHVHVKRSDSAGFLFRVDPQPGGNVVIVVLSALEPDWGYAFNNAGHLLAAPLQKPRALELKIGPGAQFRFRLLANPVKRSPRTKAHWLKDKAAGEKIKRPRLQLTWAADENPAEVFKGWLEERGENAGFVLRQVDVSRIGYVYVNKGGEEKGQRLRSVRYEGVLEVTDADKFRVALASGIGPAKAFGFGLLSITPAG